MPNEEKRPIALFNGSIPPFGILLGRIINRARAEMRNFGRDQGVREIKPQVYV
jgi:hypothetical protein